MKLLLDENMPVDLRFELLNHDCETVTYRGWNGKQNGELLSAASEAGFQALLTKDTKLPYQQAEFLPIAVIVLRSPTKSSMISARCCRRCSKPWRT